MSARADTSVWLDDEAPQVRVNRLTARADDPTPRAILSIGDVLSVFGPADVLRATLMAALEALDAVKATP